LLGLFILAIGGLNACVNAPNYPNQPKISLQSASYTKGTAGALDSIVTVINFQDGNGDIGLGPNASDDPKFTKYLDRDSIEYNPFFNNLWLRVFVQRANGAYDSIAPFYNTTTDNRRILDTRYFDARTPVFVRPAGITDVEGTIRVVSRDVFGLDAPGHPGFVSGRKFYLKIHLADRAMNVSNTLVTNPQTIP